MQPSRGHGTASCSQTLCKATACSRFDLSESEKVSVFCVVLSFRFPKPFLPLKETLAALQRLDEKLQNVEHQDKRRSQEQGRMLQELTRMQGQRLS